MTPFMFIRCACGASAQQVLGGPAAAREAAVQVSGFVDTGRTYYGADGKQVPVLCCRKCARKLIERNS